jgi:hypothetical protein
MPEVVEDEIVKHAVKAGRESVDRIRSGFSRLARLTGSESEYEDLVPPDDTLESGTRERLRELDALPVRIPFTLEHAKSALQRVNDGTPPNGPKNQQFKDSAIWEAALDLSREYDVHLVTQDNAFFQNRKPDKGLARNLMEDCEAVGGSVTAHPDLRSCLEAIKEGVPSLDPQELAAAADRAVMGELRETAEAQEFELGELESYNVSAFLTEKTHVLALSFELTYEAALAVTGQEQPVDAVVIATGDCSFDMRESTASDVRLSRLTLIDQEDGQLPGKGVQYVYAGPIVNSGERSRIRPHEIRLPIETGSLDDLLKLLGRS